MNFRKSLIPIILSQTLPAEVEFRGNYELGFPILNLEASEGQLIMNHWRQRFRTLWKTPIISNPSEILEPVHTYYEDERTGFLLGEQIAMGGGHLFLSSESAKIETFDESPLGNFYRTDRLNLGGDGSGRLVTDFEGSGDLLFASSRDDFKPENTISVFNTRPSFVLEQEFFLPNTNFQESRVQWNVAASGDLLIAYPKDTRLTEEVRLVIYRRSGSGDSPWLLDQEMVFPSRKDSPCFLDTDGENIAMAYTDGEDQVIEILSKDASDNYASIYKTNWEDLLDGADPSDNPFTGISIDGSLTVVGMIRETSEQVSRVVPIEEQGGIWVPQPVLMARETNVLSGLAETADGLIFAATETSILQYGLVGGHNKRPVITSTPPTQAVAGRNYRYEIAVVDETPDLLEVIADELPSWLTLTNEEGRWLLAGRAPEEIEKEETVRIRVGDPHRAEEFQTFRLATVLESGLPTFTEEPGNVLLKEGARLELSVQAKGAPPLTWQWYRDGEPISGANQATISIGSIAGKENGNYQLEAMNVVGSALSSEIEVKIDPATRFAGDWPTLGGSSRHLGHSAAGLGTHRFFEAWSIQAIPDGNSWHPVIADGRVFVSARSGPSLQVHAFDLKTGVPVWTSDLGESKTMDPPTYHDGRIYLQGLQNRSDAYLWALDAGTGELIWDQLFPEGLGQMKGPTINEQGIWVSAKDGRVSAIRGFDFDGSAKASMITSPSNGWSPTLQNDRLYSWVRGRLSQYDPETGEELWFYLTDFFERAGNNMDTLLPIDDNIAVIKTPRRLICVDLRYQVAKWQTTDALISEYDAVPSGTATIHRDRVYSIFDRSILSFDLDTGEIKSTYDFGSRVVSEQPLVTNDHLIAATADETRIYSLDTGDLVQTLPTGGFVSFSNGYLMVASEDGNLHAYFANDIPDFLTESLPDAIEDIDYDFALSFSHDDPDETLIFRKISGPSWLDVSPTGHLSGSFGDIPVTTENLVVEVSDGVTPPVGKSFPITMIAVNDPPEVAVSIDDVIANHVADSISLDLSASFNDPDLNETLMYSIGENTNPAIFSNLMVGATDGMLTLEFAPYQSGSSSITLRVTDLGGLFVEQTFTVTLPDLPIPTFAQTGAITLNRQTGLFEQRLTFTNTAARAIGGFALDISLADDAFKLHQSENNRLNHAIPLEAGATVDFVLEYFSGTSRLAPVPGISISLILPDSTSTETPSPAELARIFPLPDKSILLEFESIPENRYLIQYSHDMITWFTSPVMVEAVANRSQWLDQGPPRTNCHPAECPMRTYRLLTLPTAE